MSIHISAKKGEIAKVVLQPGDPLRAQYIAENFLQDAKLVSKTRGIFYYTGLYKGKTISVGASGMGFPSIGIYSYELFTEYDVETIIRIGTCGAYTTDLKVFDLLNVENAASESTYAKYAWGIEDDIIAPQGNVFNLINETAEELSLKAKATNIHSSDIFYRKDPDIPAIATKYNCMAVEMEAFGLFANAKHLGKNAATILTVSDIIPTHENISADQREKALKPMIELALESAWKLV
ncbi:purine-nucleoside phosphorylase [Chryseobacterium defluvii]|uniref:Uridine phosphorylase n=1 Tax=Chryseobacterium defluvii TaxID=160396 RepID=A0A840KGX6_9FLAO|nr:purine-nucleoside phosphorylase [Chryseobacterium defluvii]MBB4807935.1 purine-nucleoside phosphorylase [Chryseobacterium defluvii]